MKTSFTGLLLIILTLLASVTCALAQVDTNSVPAAGIPDVVNGIAEKAPWLVTVFLVIGVLRFAIKPIMSIILHYVEQTPSTADDEAFKRITESKVMQVALYILDWVASIKIARK